MRSWRRREFEEAEYLDRQAMGPAQREIRYLTLAFSQEREYMVLGHNVALAISVKLRLDAAQLVSQSKYSARRALLKHDLIAPFSST